MAYPLVAERGNTGGGAAAGANIPVALTDPTLIAVGHHLTIRLAAYWDVGRAPTGVTDPRGNTWQIDRAWNGAAGSVQGAVLSCEVENAYQAGDSLTVHFGGAVNNIVSIVVEEWEDFDPTDWFDDGNSAGASSAAFNSGTVTPDQADVLLLGVFSAVALITDVITPTDAEWTALTTKVSGASNRLVAGHYRVLDAIAAHAYAGTISTSRTHVEGVLAYRLAASGPQPIDGTADFDLQPVELDATGSVVLNITGTAAVDLQAIELDAEGEFVEHITGAADVEIAAFSLDAVGVVGIVGAADVDLSALEIDATGLVVLDITGTADVDLSALEIASSGTMTPPAVTGTAAVTLQAIEIDANGPQLAIWAVTIDGTLRTEAVDFTALVVENRAFEGSGTARLRIIELEGDWEPTTEESVVITHFGVTLFEGYVRKVQQSDPGFTTGPRIFDLDCQDYTTLLDDDVIEEGFRSTVESDKARIAWLVDEFSTRGVTAGAEVQAILASMPVAESGAPEQDFSGMTLREAINTIARLSGARYYVDYDKKLHYFLTESEAAPFALSDEPDNLTTFGYADFSMEDDSIDQVHEVLVIGTDVKVWCAIGSPPALGERRRGVIRDDDITSVAQANEVGDAYLDLHSTPTRNASLKTWTAGLRAGQTLEVTHTAHGLVAESFRIVSVVAHAKGDLAEFTITLGDEDKSLDAVIGGQRRSIDVLAQQTTVQGAALRGLQAAGANLVHDSSFEASTDDAWIVGTGWTHGHIVAGSDTAHRGSKVARLSLSAATGQNLLPADAISVDRTSDYWFSFWSYLRSFTLGRATAYVSEYNSGGSVLARTALVEHTASESDWTRHSVHFGPTEQLGRRVFHANTVSVRITFNTVNLDTLAFTTSTLTWDIDGVQVERGNLLTAFAPMPEELYNVAGEVVIDESGVTIINGALVVKNPGGTVIIDGTSDMFRIVATGTLNLPLQSSEGKVSVTATLATGLTFRPANMMYLHTGGNLGAVILPFYLSYHSVPIADTPAGMIDWYLGGAQLVNGNETKVYVEKNTARSAGLGAISVRYYVLDLVAI